MFDKWSLNANYDDYNLTMSFDLGRSGNERLWGNARMPMNLSFTGDGDIILPKSPIQIEIKSDEIDLAILEGFTQQVQKVKGKLLVNALVTNTIDNPKVSAVLLSYD